jgi:CBS domain-containing protein
MSITVAELLQDKARQSPGSILFSVSPEAPTADAVAMMVGNKISSVVVKESENMVGLITLRELLRGLSDHGDALLSITCGAVMKKNPAVARVDDTADHLRGLMTELHITHVPVVDAEKLIGILSFHDIARSTIKDADFENKLLKQYIKHWPE